MDNETNKRDIPIRDGHEKSAEEESPPEEKSGPERIISGSAAANAYRRQSGDEKQAAGRQEPSTGKEERAGAEEKQNVEQAADEVTKAMDELQERYVRLHAEFDNFRKRTQRERVQIRNRAAADLMSDLLPVLDNFNLALKADSENSDSFRAGVEMINKQLRESLQRHGLSEMEAEGQEFDPEFHEALMTEASSKHREGHVIEVLQDGYLLNGSVLRPARVKVSSGAPEDAESTDQSE